MTRSNIEIWIRREVYVVARAIYATWQASDRIITGHMHEPLTCAAMVDQGRGPALVPRAVAMHQIVAMDQYAGRH